MAERETSRSIDAAAAAWVAREDRTPLTSDEEAALNAWLRVDARNAGALLRARAVALRSESARALGGGYDP
ncbi:MAG: anti-sigma factor, partial [Brevundimonas sp.]